MKEGKKVEIKLLVKRAKAGDKDDLLELVMDQKDNYYKLAYVYLKNPEDSMDAVQDMITILYNNIQTTIYKNLKKKNLSIVGARLYL